MSWDECFRRRALEILSYIVRMQLKVEELKPIAPSLVLPKEMILDFIGVGRINATIVIVVCEFYSYSTPPTRRDFAKIMALVSLIAYKSWEKTSLSRVYSVIISVRPIPFLREFEPKELEDEIYAVRLVRGAPPTIIIEVEKVRKFPLLLVFHPRRVLEALDYYLTRPTTPEARLALTLISELIGNYSGEVVRMMVEKMRGARPVELPPEALELAEVILEKMSEVRPERTIETITGVVRRRKELPPEALELAKVILERVSKTDKQAVVKLLKEMLRKIKSSERAEET